MLNTLDLEQLNLRLNRLEQEVIELKRVVTALLIAQSEKPKKSREEFLEEALKKMGSFGEMEE